MRAFLWGFWSAGRDLLGMAWAGIPRSAPPNPLRLIMLSLHSQRVDWVLILAHSKSLDGVDDPCEAARLIIDGRVDLWRVTGNAEVIPGDPIALFLPHCRPLWSQSVRTTLPSQNVITLPMRSFARC